MWCDKAGGGKITNLICGVSLTYDKVSWGKRGCPYPKRS